MNINFGEKLECIVKLILGLYFSNVSLSPFQKKNKKINFCKKTNKKLDFFGLVLNKLKLSHKH